LKPIETGVLPDTEGADALALRRVSTFHVKPNRTPYTFREPVSPHLAARLEGTTIDLDRCVDWVRTSALGAGIALVELPGGLFSPLGPDTANVDLVRALEPHATLLVAPNRLGVLHDVSATCRAAASANVSLSGIVLIDAPTPDASTSSNAAELSCVTTVPLVAALPRAEVATLALRPELRELRARLGLMPS
jgi:dethiobiotin synthetase